MVALQTAAVSANVELEIKIALDGKSKWSDTRSIVDKAAYAEQRGFYQNVNSMLHALVAGNKSNAELARLVRKALPRATDSLRYLFLSQVVEVCVAVFLFCLPSKMTVFFLFASVVAVTPRLSNSQNSQRSGQVDRI
jgi:hypothetical protein